MQRRTFLVVHGRLVLLCQQGARGPVVHERSMNNSTLAHVELDEGAVPNLGCCPAGGSSSRLEMLASVSCAYGS